MGKYKLNIGDVYRANCGDMCKVIERIDGMHVVIEWQDEFKHKQIARPERVMSGKLYNPFCKSIYGVGYIGVGEYSPSKHKKIYSTWLGTFIRSYDQKFLLEKPTYSGCSVFSDWYNFQTFARWCENQPGFGLEGYELDKDFIVKGNKIYGPKTCVFIPGYVNSVFSASDSIRGDFPLGVSLGALTRSKGQRYIAQIKMRMVSTKHKRHLGSFSSSMEAHKAWQLAKSLVIQNVLNAYSVEKSFDTRVAERLLAEMWELLYDASVGKETKSFYGR